MAIDIKFTKFDNTPWGFRLAGGSDFPQPLTVIRVSEGSLADCMGLRVGDVVVRLNDQPVSSYTHGKAHEALILAGNNFVLGVLRCEEPERAVGAIQEEKIVPYNIPLEELPPVFPPEEPKQPTPEPVCETEDSTADETVEPPLDPDVVALLSKPTDANSEVVANKNLTDEEIALLILEEEELLPEQGVLGVNFKKLRPRAPLLKESKVFEELQMMQTADPPQVQELKRFTTFLQKPERPVPEPKLKLEQPKGEGYRVIIQKRHKTVTERLIEQGLLEPATSPLPGSQRTTPCATPEPPIISEDDVSRPGSKIEQFSEIVEESHESTDICRSDRSEERETQSEAATIEEDEEIGKSNEELPACPKFDKEKIQKLVSTELNLEKQLESVQSQLLALKQLPSEIENHLRIVSEQLHKIMELSGAMKSGTPTESNCGSETSHRERHEPDEADCENPKQSNSDDEEKESADGEKAEHRGEINGDDDEQRNEDQSGNENSSVPPSEIGDVPKIVEPECETESIDVEILVEDRGAHVKKCIESYESQVMRSRGPSPAFSDGSFKPDPNLSAKDQVIQELQQKQGRKHSHDLWPQAKQVELTFGRRWRCPNDFFNDDMIAEVLSSQAEVIRGRTLGINFKKYEKTNLPNYDHLMDSSVYKMVHKMEKEPKTGIPVRPAKVNAAEDILERVRSPSLSVADDGSTRSVSH